jgi:hypothetical protein
MSVTEDAIARRDTAWEHQPAEYGSGEGGEGAEGGDEPVRRRLPERAANALDRYSLALQLVQVFPIVAEAVVVVVSTAWIARAVSGVLLVAGTAWVVRRERAIELRTLKPRRAGPDPEVSIDAASVDTVSIDGTHAVVQLPPIRVDAGEWSPEVCHVAAVRGGEILISIRLRPAPPAPDRNRRRPPRRSRNRPGT